MKVHCFKPKPSHALRPGAQGVLLRRPTFRSVNFRFAKGNVARLIAFSNAKFGELNFISYLCKRFRNLNRHSRLPESHETMKDRIISLMKHLGMSQKVFANEICISEGALSSIFSGRTKPTLNTVNNIHERFPEVNMSWLIDGKGEMFTSPAPGTVSAEGHDGGSATAGSQPVPSPTQLGLTERPGGIPQAGIPNPLLTPDAKILDRPVRRIAEIRVFYDDGTFETFPAKA